MSELATLDAPNVPVAQLNDAPAPEAQEEKKTKQQKNAMLPKYPNIPETGLKAVPEDFDPSKHRALRSKDFEQKLTYLEYRLCAQQKAVAKIEAEIAEEKDFLANPEKRQAKAKESMYQKRFASGLESDPNMVNAVMERFIKENPDSPAAKQFAIMLAALQNAPVEAPAAQ